MKGGGSADTQIFYGKSGVGFDVGGRKPFTFEFFCLNMQRCILILMLSLSSYRHRLILTLVQSYLVEA